MFNPNIRRAHIVLGQSQQLQRSGFETEKYTFAVERFCLFNLLRKAKGKVKSKHLKAHQIRNKDKWVLLHFQQIWAVTFRKVIPTEKIVNKWKFWQALMEPWRHRFECILVRGYVVSCPLPNAQLHGWSIYIWVSVMITQHPDNRETRYSNVLVGMYPF